MQSFTGAGFDQASILLKSVSYNYRTIIHSGRRLSDIDLSGTLTGAVDITGKIWNFSCNPILRIVCKRLYQLVYQILLRNK